MVRENCVVCGEKIVKTRGGKKRRGGPNAVCDSKRCSRIYNRVYAHVKWKIEARRNKDLKKKWKN